MVQTYHRSCYFISEMIEASVVRGRQITLCHSVVAVLFYPAGKLSLFIIMSIVKFVGVLCILFHNS